MCRLNDCNEKFRLSDCNEKHSTALHTGPDSRFLSKQLFFSCFLADFDAQYDKSGVFGVKEFIFGKKYKVSNKIM